MPGRGGFVAFIDYRRERRYFRFPLPGREYEEQPGTPLSRKKDSPCEIITDIDHPALKPVRCLHRREERERTGLFWTEGTRFLFQAVEQKAALETLIVCPELLVHPTGRKIARDLRRQGVSCLTVTAEVFRGLSFSAEPQGIAAVARQRWEALGSVRPSGRGLCWVALERVQSPGNLGTILRTSDAVGASGVILIGDDTDPYAPAVVRATMGAVFTQRFVRASWEEFAQWKRRTGCLLVGTSPSPAAQEYRRIAYASPLILFLGWERKGLSEEHQALCDVMVRIPMVGRSDSLNVAVAAGILLYEVFHQQRGGHGAKPNRKAAVIPPRRAGRTGGGRSRT